MYLTAEVWVQSDGNELPGVFTIYYLLRRQYYNVVMYSAIGEPWFDVDPALPPAVKPRHTNKLAGRM